MISPSSGWYNSNQIFFYVACFTKLFQVLGAWPGFLSQECKLWLSNRLLLVGQFQKLILHHALDGNNVLFQKLYAHSLKKTWESPKYNPHFSLGIKKKRITCLVAMVKKTWFFLVQKMGIPNFLLFFEIKKNGIPKFCTIFRIPIFKVNIWVWEFPSF